MTPSAIDDPASEQLSYLDPVARARRTDPETSRQAARSVEKIRESQALILQVLRGRGPMTDEEIWACLVEREFFGQHPLSPSGARTRRKELVKAGHVLDSGEKKTTQAGRKTIVWKAAISALDLQHR